MIDEQPTRDVIALRDGSILTTHPVEHCVAPCPVHAPTDHPLRDAEQIWLRQLGMLMRLCAHDVVHPDPDDFQMKLPLTNRFIMSLHDDCDGCCGLT